MAENETITHEHILRITGETDFSGVDKQFQDMIKNLDKVTKTTAKVSKGWKELKSAGSTFSGLARSIIAVTGATVGLKASLNVTVEYNKALVKLSSQFAKYNIGINQVEKSLVGLSKELKLTRIETSSLFAMYEKGFPYVSLEGAVKVFKNIRNAVGTNKQAIDEMFQSLSSLSSQFPELQRMIESLNEADANPKALKNRIEMLYYAKQISLVQYKGAMDYVKQNAQSTEQDKEKQRMSDEYAQTMTDISRIWQEIALTIGKEVVPYFEKLSNFLSDNEKYIKNITGFLAKWAPYLIALTGLKVAGGAAMSAVSGLGNIFGGALGAFAKRGSPTNPMYVTSIGSGIGSAGGRGRGLGRGGALAVGGLGLAGAAAYGLGAMVPEEHSTLKSGLNVAGGALSGAATGALIGSVIPGLGTALGGLIGGAIGAGKALWDLKQKADDAARDAAQKVKDKKYNTVASADYKKMYGAYTGKGEAYSKENVAKMTIEQQEGYLKQRKARQKVYKERGLSASSDKAMTSERKEIDRLKKIVKAGTTITEMTVGIGLGGVKSTREITSQSKEAKAAKESIKKRQWWVDRIAGAKTEEERAQMGLGLTQGRKGDSDSVSAREASYKKENVGIEQLEGKIDSDRAAQYAEQNALLGATISKKQALMGLTAAIGQEILSSGQTPERNEAYNQSIEATISTLKGELKVISDTKKMAEERRDASAEGSATRAVFEAQIAKLTSDESKNVKEIADTEDSIYALSSNIAQITMSEAQSRQGILASLVSQMQIIGNIDPNKAFKAYENTVAAFNKGREDVLTKIADLEATLATTALDKTVRRKQLQDKINTAKAEEQGITQQINQAMLTHISLYEKKNQLAQVSAQAAKIEVTLMDSLVVGLGASVDARYRSAAAVEKQISVAEQELAGIMKMDQSKDTVQIKRREAENKIKNLMLDEANILKSIRDGWVSSIQAMTIGSGRITKLTISSNENLRQGLSAMNMIRSASSGATQRAGERNTGFMTPERLRAEAGGTVSIDNKRTSESAYSLDTGDLGSTPEEAIRNIRKNNARARAKRGVALGVKGSGPGGSPFIAPGMGTGTGTGQILPAEAAARARATGSGGNVSGGRSTSVVAKTNVMNLNWSFSFTNIKDAVDTIGKKLSDAFNQHAKSAKD